MQCGIVGLPNVGKSTLFNLMTQTRKARADNFPFCTIEPNVAEVPYLDQSLTYLSNLYESEKTIYSSLKFVDIAGLVPNAHSGEGLGNKFLGHILEVDLILNVVRSFDAEVTHVLGEVNPARDLDVIFSELLLSDLERATKMLNKNKTSQELKDIITLLENGKCAPAGTQFLTAKPMIVLCNGPLQDGLIGYCQKKNYPLLSVDMGFLEELSFTMREQQQDLDPTIYQQLNEILALCFDRLNLIRFFTVGPKEARSWIIPRNIPANLAAGKIHSDFEKKMVSVEVSKFDSMNNVTGPEIHGKNYIVQDKDILLFRVAR